MTLMVRPVGRGNCRLIPLQVTGASDFRRGQIIEVRGVPGLPPRPLRIIEVNP